MKIKTNIKSGSGAIPCPPPHDKNTPQCDGGNGTKT
jgi:hypothetical protein